MRLNVQSSSGVLFPFPITMHAACISPYERLEFNPFNAQPIIITASSFRESLSSFVSWLQRLHVSNHRLLSSSCAPFCVLVRIRKVSLKRPVNLALLLCSSTSSSPSRCDCSLKRRSAAIRSSGGAVRSLVRSRNRDTRRLWWFESLTSSPIASIPISSSPLAESGGGSSSPSAVADADGTGRRS